MIKEKKPMILEPVPAQSVTILRNVARKVFDSWGMLIEFAFPSPANEPESSVSDGLLTGGDPVFLKPSLSGAFFPFPNT